MRLLALLAMAAFLAACAPQPSKPQAPVHIEIEGDARIGVVTRL